MPDTMWGFLDDMKKDAAEKMLKFVGTKYGGKYEDCFRDYAGPDDSMTSAEMSSMLSDAGIGNFLTRPAYVAGIMEKLDADKDGKISRQELVDLIQGK